MPTPELAGLPAGGPATLAGVKARLGITDGASDAALTTQVDAVNAKVRGWRCSEAAVGDDDWTGAPQVVAGATLLAMRLWRRKNSPAGVEAFGEGGAAYVMRNDPDIAQMLNIGTWALPGIG